MSVLINHATVTKINHSQIYQKENKSLVFQVYFLYYCCNSYNQCAELALPDQFLLRA